MPASVNLFSIYTPSRELWDATTMKMQQRSRNNEDQDATSAQQYRLSCQKAAMHNKEHKRNRCSNVPSAKHELSSNIAKNEANTYWEGVKKIRIF